LPGFFRKILIFLGLAEEEDEYLEQEKASQREYLKKPVIKRIKKNKVDNIGTIERYKESLQSEVHIIEPHNFSDAKSMGDKFKEDIPVIINLQEVDQELAKRIIDFASGLAYGLNGGIQRVADRVFLITPYNVEVSAEERIRLQERGLFNQF